MAASRKKSKFDTSLSISEKVERVLQGIEFELAQTIQDRISEVFNSRKMDFALFVKWMDTEEGEKFLAESDLVSASVLLDIFQRCKGQAQTDWENGDKFSLLNTANYVFDSSFEIYDYQWASFNELK